MAHQRIVIDTLAAVKRYGYKLTAHCDGCGRAQALDIDTLIARLGSDFELCPQRLNPLMLCARCGRKGAAVYVAPIYTGPR